MSYVLNPTGCSRRVGCAGRCACNACNGYFSPRTLTAFGMNGCGCGRRNVFYEGPCPEGAYDDCSCHHLPPFGPPPCRPPFPIQPREEAEAAFDDRRHCRFPCQYCKNIFGYFAQLGTLTAVANEPIPIASLVQESGLFELSDDRIIFAHAGIFMATLTLNLPAGSTVDATIELKLNGERVRGSVVKAEHAAGAPGTVCIQVLFEVCHPRSELALVSDQSFVLTAEEANQTLCSLMLFQIC